jgi:hypothetical protein
MKFLLLLALLLQADIQTKSFARVVLYRNLAVVTLDDSVQAEQMIVTVFYRQDLSEITNSTEASTTTLLRSMVDVQPALKGAGVAIKSVEDPSRVQFVRIELVKNTGSMEWKP